MSVRSFPAIKEVRTFLIEGVGSGGDYHNVSIVVIPLCIIREEKQQWH